MSHFSQKLIELRRQLGCSQQQLAEATGLSRSAIGMYETGKREIPTRFVVALAKYYKVSTDYILGLNDSNK